MLWINFRYFLRTYFRLARWSFFGAPEGGPPRTPRRLLAALIFLPLFFFSQLAHWIGFALDELLFAEYREITVRQPVFIVGVPRSGTTLLHRALAADEERFTSLKLWELLFAPSICERLCLTALSRLDRALGAPAARLLAAAQRRLLNRIQDFHPVELDAPEEDYFLLLPICACFLLIHPFPFAEIRRLTEFDARFGEGEQLRVLEFYKRCVQRHLFVHGAEKQLLSKNPSFTPLMQNLDRMFPDCTFIACLRSPLQAAPSLLNSMRAGAELFGNDLSSAAFRDPLLEMLRAYYQQLAAQRKFLPPSRFALLNMERLTGDLRAALAELYARFGWTLSDAAERRLAAECSRARAFRSAHRYSLEQFELTAEQLAEYFAPAFAEFAFELPQPAAAGVEPALRRSAF